MKEKCNNCGWALTEDNIRLALEDAGVSHEELTFYCPSYTKEDGCKGVVREDKSKSAYWRTK